jgi:hypothetical protein
LRSYRALSPPTILPKWGAHQWVRACQNVSLSFEVLTTFSMEANRRVRLFGSCLRDLGASKCRPTRVAYMGTAYALKNATRRQLTSEVFVSLYGLSITPIRPRPPTRSNRLHMWLRVQSSRINGTGYTQALVISDILGFVLHAGGRAPDHRYQEVTNWALSSIFVREKGISRRPERRTSRA